ncbi:hypothetical protein MPTK1_5g22110 [Marchantia polymorpha subsp. ruderalis]|uniref:Uncharacterized protein n=2 Tax=Marchantia polymorpha TaxID=3197 RepID=A0AAF6BL06_MARPO|nr:hypothetical protein MARPO_0166s0005 [Marchantia polymorpha]BBN12690.1 hypothetical protein Mp_5g22110 [Marchantia polymorpha subsp. ruderalis]|eukprot:PTQ28346.1 hypothetical protein MARPO_0166s0005 [Marchantia polymorpha]
MCRLAIVGPSRSTKFRKAVFCVYTNGRRGHGPCRKICPLCGFQSQWSHACLLSRSHNQKIQSVRTSLQSFPEENKQKDAADQRTLQHGCQGDRSSSATYAVEFVGPLMRYLLLQVPGPKAPPLHDISLIIFHIFLILRSLARIILKRRPACEIQVLVEKIWRWKKKSPQKHSAQQIFAPDRGAETSKEVRKRDSDKPCLAQSSVSGSHGFLICWGGKHFDRL